MKTRNAGISRKFVEYAGISRNFAQYHGISGNITEFRGISRNFVVHVECAPVFTYNFQYRVILRLSHFSLTGTVSTSPNLAKEGARSATIITRPLGSRFS